MKKQLIALLIIMAAVRMAFADDTTETGIYQPMPFDKSTHGLFQANELSLDLFGADAWRDHTVSHLGEYNNHDSHLAAGLGLNYFILKYVGFGADAYSFNTAHHTVDNLGGNLILRAPLVLGLAPYAFGGAGHQFDPNIATYGDAGAGLEWRFVHNVGIFADARYVWTDRDRNYTLGRVGLRLAF